MKSFSVKLTANCQCLLWDHKSKSEKLLRFSGLENPSERKNVILSWKNVYFLEQQIQIQYPKKKVFAILEKGTSHTHTLTPSQNSRQNSCCCCCCCAAHHTIASHRLLPLYLSLSNLIDKQRKVTDRVSWNFRVVALRSCCFFSRKFLLNDALSLSLSSDESRCDE